MSNLNDIHEIVKEKNLSPYASQIAAECMVELCEKCLVKKKFFHLEDVISTLSHDLKTPLIAEQVNLKHFLNGDFGGVSNNQKEILQLLYKNNESALRLVNNLLSVFKYEANAHKLLIEKVDILKLIKKCILNVKPLLDEKEISIKVSPYSVFIFCDQYEIERVIVNLLTNSIKFTSNNGHIEIKAFKNENGLFTFSIQDSGRGITHEDLLCLFERFWQTKKAGERSQGTGLGLYLSRQIIQAHNGRIWVESELGKGTKVTFEIPELVK